MNCKWWDPLQSVGKELKKKKRVGSRIWVQKREAEEKHSWEISEIFHGWKCGGNGGLWGVELVAHIIHGSLSIDLHRYWTRPYQNEFVSAQRSETKPKIITVLNGLHWLTSASNVLWHCFIPIIPSGDNCVISSIKLKHKSIQLVINSMSCCLKTHMEI